MPQLQNGDLVRIVKKMKDTQHPRRDKIEVFKARITHTEYRDGSNDREWGGNTPFQYFTYVPEGNGEYICAWGTAKLYDGEPKPYGVQRVEILQRRTCK